MKKYFLGTVLLIFSLSPAFAQQSQTGIEKFFPTSKLFVKFNPFILLNGEFPVFIEVGLAPRVSVEVAPGITMYSTMFEWQRRFGSPRYEVTNHTYGIGYTFRAALKYFTSPEQNFHNGFYVSPEVQYKIYNIRELCGSTDVLSERKLFDARAMCGYQLITKTRSFYEIYMGFGLRFRNYIERDCYNTHASQVISEHYMTEPIPTFAAGIKIGFGL